MFIFSAQKTNNIYIRYRVQIIRSLDYKNNNKNKTMNKNENFVQYYYCTCLCFFLFVKATSKFYCCSPLW